MARSSLYDQVEWFRSVDQWLLPTYGVLHLGKDWHAVELDDDCAHGFRVLTTVEDRKTAIGFLKLLKEN
jgi:hypothetical protein